ncbi:MAG: asparagine synthetase B [Ignavibacteria bacterium]|nr:MAG: asparagine synthetase B [Ignavibacteria bacterium]
MKRILLGLVLLLSAAAPLKSQQNILIEMDLQQADHLKAYGIVYWALTRGVEVDWLLNYKGGSFLTSYYPFIENECRVRGVTFRAIDGGTAAQIIAQVESPDENMELVRLEKAPKIAVYVPPNFQPWDDAVTLALEYAEVPYEKLWDEEVIQGKLDEYDWLHLHHEDFSGQYGKFYGQFSTYPWYIQQVAINEAMAKRLGFKKVSELKKAVARTIKDYVGGGGFMFAMCSATDTFDIALAAENTDICDVMFDGDAPDANCQSHLDFDRTFAFEKFKLIMNPYEYEYSDIDMTPAFGGRPDNDYFTLFDFSAKYDPVPSMLTQNHVNVIGGFLGQTTAFRKELIKKYVTVLAEKDGADEVKYLHGNYGRGTFTWYGGHDPEDYQHRVGDPPTDLSLHKNSPGYRLILNNILFPAARKKQLKT